MATVVNTDSVKFPLDAAQSAPIYQGENQLSVPRGTLNIPQMGVTLASDLTVGQLWPRGQRA